MAQVQDFLAFKNILLLRYLKKFIKIAFIKIEKLKKKNLKIEIEIEKLKIAFHFPTTRLDAPMRANQIAGITNDF